MPRRATRAAPPRRPPLVRPLHSPHLRHLPRKITRARIPTLRPRNQLARSDPRPRRRSRNSSPAMPLQSDLPPIRTRSLPTWCQLSRHRPRPSRLRGKRRLRANSEPVLGVDEQNKHVSSILKAEIGETCLFCMRWNAVVTTQPQCAPKIGRSRPQRGRNDD